MIDGDALEVLGPAGVFLFNGRQACILENIRCCFFARSGDLRLESVLDKEFVYYKGAQLFGGDILQRPSEAAHSRPYSVDNDHVRHVATSSLGCL